MSKKVKAEDLSKAILDTLTEYVEDVEEIVVKKTDLTIKEAKQEISTISPRGARKEYANSWATGTRKKGIHKYSKVVYNKDHYRLTHLLEFGHVTRDGATRTIAQPHIRPTEEKYKEKLLIGISKEIKR